MVFGTLKEPLALERLEPNKKYIVKKTFILQCRPKGGGSLVKINLNPGDEIKVNAVKNVGFDITVFKNVVSFPFKDIRNFFLGKSQIPDLLRNIEIVSEAASSGLSRGLLSIQVDTKKAIEYTYSGRWKKKRKS